MQLARSQKVNSTIYYRGVDAEKAEHLIARSREGSYGSGLYLGDYRCATEYSGGNGLIAAVELKSVSPYFYHVPENDEEFGELPAIPLVRQLHPSTADCIIQKVVNANSYHFGTIIEDTLIALGYDSLVVVYHDGSQEIVALRTAITRLVDIFVPTGNSPEESARITHYFVGEHAMNGISLNQWLKSISSYDAVCSLADDLAA